MSGGYYIVTLGCPKNQADSREMERSLLDTGYFPAKDASTADIIIINSCAFIQEAREETIETIFEAAGIKDHNKSAKIVLAGCFSERYREILDEEIPELDLHFGTGRYSQAGELIHSIYPLLERRSNLEIEPTTLTRPWAPLKISDGCDRRCTFCAIPSFRGSFHTISKNNILDEAARLAREGVRELDLVSQDTVAYADGDTAALFDLVDEISQLDKISWIRLLYMYPDKKLEKILRLWGERSPDKLVPYLEAPVQHVSETVLRNMGRSGNFEYYKDLFLMARDLIPDLEIRTSLILGFPGEEHRELDEIINFLAIVKPERLALFAFSPEEGTPSADMQPATTAISERINLIRKEHDLIFRDIQKRRVGTTVQCMIDSVDADEIIGRRKQDMPEADGVVQIPFREGVIPGEIYSVQIDGFIDFDLTGEIVEKDGL